VESRRLAIELNSAMSVLSKFDEGPDLVLYYKELMVLEGFEEYTHQLNPSDKLSPSQRQYLHSQWSLFKNWWKNWAGS
jgi:4-hydroxy-tetrahydrodipicolinate synthase